MCIAHRMIWNIVLAIFCRLVVFVGINTKHTEVAGLTRPHPVVGIASKLTQTLRWSKHQTYIIETLIDRQIILTTFIIRCNLTIDAVHGIKHSFLQTGGYAVHIEGFSHLIHSRLYTSQYLVSHIDRTEMKSYIQFRIGEFVLQTFS